MPNPIVLSEEVVPKFLDRDGFNNDRAYVDHIYNSIKSGMQNVQGVNGSAEGITIATDMVSPVWRIRKIYESVGTDTGSLSDKQIDKIIKHSENIQKIKNSLCQRGTTADKFNFYMCWSMYELGCSWTHIYETSYENCAWDSDDKKTVIRKLQRMAKRFNWQRNHVR